MRTLMQKTLHGSSAKGWDGSVCGPCDDMFSMPQSVCVKTTEKATLHSFH
eukprot:m.953051 g.953051  ORF g.953051 m.953051 type:complete len:50 (-) comp23869_c0_seq11:2685-2834(-)